LGSTSLIEIVEDNIFLSISNLYFFNQSIKRNACGLQYRLLSVLVLDFEDVLLVMAIAGKCGEYLAEEPGLDI